MNIYEYYKYFYKTWPVAIGSWNHRTRPDWTNDHGFGGVGVVRLLIEEIGRGDPYIYIYHLYLLIAIAKWSPPQKKQKNTGSAVKGTHLEPIVVSFLKLSSQWQPD